MTDNLEHQIAEALKDAVTPVFCGVRPPDRADVAAILAPRIAGALKAAANVYSGYLAPQSARIDFSARIAAFVAYLAGEEI